MYDFQSVVERRGTTSIKWHMIEDDMGVGSEDVIAMSVADMEFKPAPEIVEALVEAAQHDIFGYDYATDGYFRALTAWMSRRHNWDIDPAWVSLSDGVMPAVNTALRAVTHPGDKVILQGPVYYPFTAAAEHNGLTILDNRLILGDDGHYVMDFDDLEAKASDPRCTALMLCNPHNPIGKVLTREEMLRLSDLAAKYDVRIFSDEIHAPFVYQGHTHVPFASINRQTAMQAFTSTSASKSFNIPGTKCAQVILTNPDDLELWMRNAEWSEHQTATIGAIATTAAYDGGAAWFEGVMAYIERNIALVNEQMRTRFAKVRYVEPQGTYIAWLDFSPLGIGDPANYFFKKANVALTDGRECGEVGRGCVRMNFAMPYPLLEECFDRMAAALEADGLL